MTPAAAALRVPGEHLVREAEGVRDRIGRGGRMDEHDRATPLQLGEDVVEAVVPEVSAAGVREQSTRRRGSSEVE